ncbi:MAG: VOC family protein [Actinomycetota bacterium]|nr:VOC family protein [Actinomycetota bacterium]
MQIKQQIIVFDAADLDAESEFWAAVLGGSVSADDEWHTVHDADKTPRIGVQLAPDHIRPDWPNGTPQQIHLDLYVDDITTAHDEVTALGATLLQAYDPDHKYRFQVYADPAGHPFCLCWGD